MNTSNDGTLETLNTTMRTCTTFTTWQVKILFTMRVNKIRFHFIYVVPNTVIPN